MNNYFNNIGGCNVEGRPSISIYVARVVATKSYTKNNIVIVQSIYILPNIKEESVL